MIMLSHILKLIANQWKSNLWILAELFISFVCLFLVFLFVARLIGRDVMDKGFDIEHVYKVSWSLREVKGDYTSRASDTAADLAELVNRLRRYSGVEAVGLTDNYAFPYTGSSNSKAFYRDTLRSNYVNWGRMTPEAVRVFRYRSIDPDIDLCDEASQARYLFGKAEMEELFGPDVPRGMVRNKKEGVDDRLALGTTGSVARCEYFDDNSFVWEMTNEEKLIRDLARPQALHIFIRVRPAADHDFINRFWHDMSGHLQAGDCMISNIVSMEDYRAQLLNGIGIDLFYVFAYVLVGFFLLCAFLGVIGAFWFRTQARTPELGLRMALGSTRRDVRRLVLGEGLTLFALVWVPGVVVVYLMRDAVNILNLPLPLSDGWFFTLIGLLTTLVMALLITAGVWTPARQASRINPVDALRYE